ncbi:hypothetical protein HYV91_01265 [Candidatus Wolfebacteria bacterium]|nr:hypothetical protein [Candidatus Wolfebacteria bacterium]
MDRKKIVIVVVIVIGALALGAGVYFAWRNAQTILNPPEGGGIPPVGNQVFKGTTTSSSGQIGTAKLKVLSRNEVSDYWLYQPFASSTPEIYYLTPDGKIMKVPGSVLSVGGRGDGDEKISDEAIFDVQSIKPSRDGKLVLIKSGDRQNPKFTLYDVETKIKQDLPNAVAGVFSPDVKKIAYLEKPGANGSSNLMLKDLKSPAIPKPVKLISLSVKDVELFWLDPQKIFLISPPSYQYESQAWSLDIKKGTLSRIDSGNGLMLNWSADAKIAIDFKTKNNGRVAEAKLIDKDGKHLANLDFSTLPTKCFVSQPQIYCGLPQFYSLPQEPLLPDDYLKKAVYSRDFIYLIDTEKNSIEPIFTSLEPTVDLWHLSKIENQLFFVNRYDNKLYGLSL